MKFGIILPSYLPQASAEGIRETALLSEELGYDSVWTTDHVMIPRGSPAPYESIFEALSTAAWLAGITRKVRIGVSVIILAQRQPVLVAKEVATIDRLSGGRFILGLGSGWCEEEFGWLNTDFHRRGRVLDEAILVLRQLWTQPEQAFRGSFFRFENQSFGPPPVQYGGPPIWIGGTSDASLKRAATLGDGWHSTRVTPADFKTRAAKLASFNPGRKLTISARMTVAEQRGDHVDARGSTFALGGSAQSMLHDLRRFEEAGCSYMALNFWEGDLAKASDAMRRFAGEVMGRV